MGAEGLLKGAMQLKEGVTKVETFKLKAKAIKSLVVGIILIIAGPIAGYFFKNFLIGLVVSLVGLLTIGLSIWQFRGARGEVERRMNRPARLRKRK